MENRTGLMPVCSIILLSVLTVLSVRAWQGADVAYEIRQLSSGWNIESIDRSMSDLRSNIRAELGLEAPTLASELPVPSVDNGALAFDNSPMNYSSGLEPLKSLQIGPAEFGPIPIAGLTHPEETSKDVLLAVNPFRDASFAKSDLDVSPAFEPVEQGRELSKTDKADQAYNPGDHQKTEIKGYLISVPVSEQQEDWNLPTQVAKEPESSASQFVAESEIPESNLKPSTPAPAPAIDADADAGATEPETVYPQWTQPKALIADLEQLFTNPMTASWAHTTVQILESLNQIKGIPDPQSQVVFQQLRRQLEKLDFITIQVSELPVNSAALAQGKVATQLRHIRYSIVRRLEIWPLIHQLSLQGSVESSELPSDQVGQFLLTSNRRLNTSDIDQGWVDYLQIESAAATFNSMQQREYAKKKAARFVLARMFSPSLSQTQQKYLHETIDQQTIDVLRISSIDPVDVEEFAKRLEKLEVNNSGANQFYLNDIYQSMIWSDNPTYHELASQVQTHYRNANFRVSISEEMLNRMMPQRPVSREPYRGRFMGADVVGQNRITNRLGINLIPDPNQISMQIVTDGRVNSRTTATKSGVVVENEGSSRFRIIKRLAFGQHGIFAYRPETTSQVAQRVVGLRSSLDNVPAVGWLVRKIARNKIEEQAPVTRQYTKNQLESQAEERFEMEIQQVLADLENTLTNRLLHPLIAMDLEPDPIEISTTADRVNMRYRLAGRDQMASYTARPSAAQSCLMSMQIHQSVANNFVDRFDLAGKKFTSDELITYVNEIMGQEVIAGRNNDSDKKRQAVLEFAHFDPIRFDFDDEQIGISFNLKSFKIGKGKKWKNLSIKATYDTQVVNGFNIGLSQGEEKLQIKGKRMNVGDKLAVGLICKALFPEQFQLALMPARLGEQLRVSNVQTTQFTISNGWMGISVDHVNARQNRTFQQAHQNQMRQTIPQVQR